MRIKSSVIYFIGPTLSAVISLATLPILTWLVSQQTIGVFSLFQTIVSFLVIFIPMGFDQAYVREYYEVDNKSQLFFIAFLPSLLIFVIFALFLLYNFDGFSLFFFHFSSKVIVYWLLVATFLSLLIRYFSIMVRMQEKAIFYSFSQLLPKISLFLLVILAFCLNIKIDIVDLIKFYVVSLLVSFLFFLLFTRGYFSVIFKVSIFSRWKLLFSYSFPLMLSGVAFWGLTAIDRLFLSKMSSFEELALYSVAISFSSAVLIIQSIFSTIWIPYVFQLITKVDNYRVIQKNIKIITFFILLIWSIGAGVSWFVPIFLPDKYSAVGLLIVITLTYPMLYTLTEATSIGINISKKTSYALLATVIALIVNCILNFYLIKLYGAIGAAVSTGISFYVYFLIKTYFSFRFFYKLNSFKRELWLISVYSFLSFSPIFFNLSYIIPMLFFVTLIVCKKEVRLMLRFLGLRYRK